MGIGNFKLLRFMGLNFNLLACLLLAAFITFFTAAYLRTVVFGGIGHGDLLAFRPPSPPPALHPPVHVQKNKFLEVPQIVWGLNNQKIAFARACLTARMLNRTLLMPTFSASLFYKEIDQLTPISFDKIFEFERFNSLCQGFVRLSRYSDALNQSDSIELHKGSGRKWTVEIDLQQLILFSKHPYDEYETMKILGKNPFLWHDHWPVKDYAKIFRCLVFEEIISGEADRVVSKIREIAFQESRKVGSFHNENEISPQTAPYVAVHMRIEKDWLIHCKKLEQRSNVREICSSKEEITHRVGNIAGLKKPVVIYLAIADDLMEDNSTLSGWKEGFLPLDKKKLGVLDVYDRHPYLIRSAIDYEVCLRSDVFVGNSFSTFSSLVVLDRTRRMMDMGMGRVCGSGVRWPSYAYNVEGEPNGPRPWATNMSDTSLRTISYGSVRVSCG